MKDKDIKKLLAENSAQILPDESVKENIKSRLGYERQEARALAGGGTQSPAISRRTLAAICAAAMAIILAVCIILPSVLGNYPSFPAISGGENKFEEITDAQSFYAYGAASVGSILSSPDEGAIAPTEVAVTTNGAHGSEMRLENINKYMGLVESLLSDGAIEGNVAEISEGYAYAMTIKHTDLLGNTVTYTMYYDKEYTGGGRDEDETEQNYSITGVLIIDDNRYPVEGTYETERENDGGESEEENELRFKAYTSEDRSSYIEVRQETESETEGSQTETETEYIYSVYGGGRLQETTVIKYEKEDNELEIALSVEKDGQRDELIFRTPEGGNGNTIVARGRIGGEQVSFTIHISEGSYRYEFSDGWNGNFDRAHDRGNRPERTNLNLLTA